NLWPEMWGTPGTPGTPLTSRGPFPPYLVGAKAKDAVENQLHKEICAGTLTLHEAQQIIATDWFQYYRDHVLKRHPVSAGENVDLNGQPFSLQRPGVTSVWINVFITCQTAFALHVCASRRRSHDVLGV